MTGERRATSTREQPEAIIEPFGDLSGREGRYAGSRQLQREGDPVQATAELGHRRCVVGVEAEVGLRGGSPIDEEPDSLGTRESGARHFVLFPGERERRHAPRGRPRDAERLAAGGQNSKVWGGLEQRFRELCARLDEMLAVVEENQERPAGQVVRERLLERPRRVLAQPERRSDSLGHESSVGERSQRHEPHAIPERLDQTCRDLLRETRLSGSAHAREREQARPEEQRLYLGDLTPPPDEGRELGREVVARCVQGLEWWEIAREIRDQELEETLRPSQILEPMLAEVPKGSALDLLSKQVTRRLRDEHLSAMGGRTNAGPAVNVLADIALGGDRRLAGVDADPHPESIAA